jgi:hypothetical protein
MSYAKNKNDASTENSPAHRRPDVSDLIAVVDTETELITVMERETVVQGLRAAGVEPEPPLLRPAGEASPPVANSLDIWVLFPLEDFQVRMTRQHITAGGDA